MSRLNKAHLERDNDTETDTDLGEIAELLYGLALLSEGGTPKAPSRFTRLIADRLERTLV